MITTVILNTILALGVIAMVVAPLVWAIRTQHRDSPRPDATDGLTIRVSQTREDRPTPRPQYKPAVGRG